MAAIIGDPRLSTPQCISLFPVKTIHENPWFVVRNRAGYFTVEYTDSHVVVLPIVNYNSIVMVRPKRPVIVDSPLELPAGATQDNETALQAAKRELQEETGIEVQDIKRFSTRIPLSNAPNRNPRLIHVFQVYITQREFDNRGAHDHEIERVELLHLKEVTRLIINGDIYVTVPMAVITRYLLENDMNTLL